MVEFLPDVGESPEDVDKRISVEAFFPVKEQELFFKNIDGDEGTLFENDLYSDLPRGATIKLERHFGILDIDTIC